MNFVGRTANIMTAIVFAPIYLNVLGAEAYGLVAFLVSVTTLASLFDLGLSSTFARSVAVDSSHESVMKCLATFGRLLAVSTGVVSLLLIIFAEAIAKHWFQNTGELDPAFVANCIRILAITLLPHFQVNLMVLGLMSQLRQVEGNFLLVSYNLLRSGLVLIPLAIWPNVLVLFAWQLGTAIVVLFLARLVLFRNSGKSIFSKAEFSTNLARSAVSFATGMFVVSVVSVCNTQLDKLVVSKFFSLNALADYALASTLAQIPLTLTTPIAASLYPFMTKLLSEKSIVAFEDTYEKFLRVIFFLTLSVCVSLIVFRREMLELWLGANNLRAESTQILSLITAGNFFLCLSLAPYHRLLAQGLTRPIAVMAVILFALSVPFSLLSVSQLGLVGAAVPWMFLSAINYFYVSIIANTSSIEFDKILNIGKMLRYFELTVFAVAPALTTLVFSNWIELGHLVKLLLVCVFSGLALILCYARGHFGELHNPSSV